jgi:thiol-disulfide isomerase/thioredoxin
MNNVKIFVFVIIVLVLGMITTAVLRSGGSATPEPGKYDQFAMCLKEKGATFYGAFWCPHCQAQKKMFGSSSKLLPYVECSTPDGKGQSQVCIDKNVTGYPTWEFVDGSRLNGEIPLTQLAEKTSCALPPENVTTQ